MRNLTSNPKSIVSLLIVFLLIYGWQDVIPNKAFAQTGQFVQEMINVDKVFSDFMNDRNIPGGSIAVVKDGRLVYARGFGYANKESNELVKPDHLFRIASVSKPITSIAIMKLIDDGAITINSKVFGTAGILSGPNYNNILDPRVKSITVRHLLHHTSGWGFINRDGDPMFLNRHIARQIGENPPVGSGTIIKFMLRTQTLNNEPGTDYFYSNFGFCVLGRIIEKISGKSYENYIKTELLNPLGITEMQLGQNLYENKAPNEVKYYDFPGAPLVNSVYGIGERVPFPYGGFNIEAMDSHGGWIASVIDLVKLLVAVDGYDTKPDILSQASIQLMTTPSTANSGYGMGWAVNQWENWWHIGDLPGTSSILVRTSNGLGWAALFNTRPSNSQDFVGQMDNMVWEAIKGIDEWPTHDLFKQVISVDIEGTVPSKSLMPDPNLEVDIEISIPTPVVRVESPDHPPMYWVDTNNGTLHRLVGTAVENLVQNVRNATSLAVDAGNQKVYWTEKTGNTTGRIRRANLDGTNVQLVKNLTSVPHGVALDPVGGKIYLTNGWGKVQRLNVDGSNFQPDLITGLDTPGGLALDVSRGKVYWTEMPGRIRRANLDGAHIQDVATGLETPINIAVSGDAIYWTEKTGTDTGKIRTTNLNGNPSVMTLHTFPQGFPVGIVVDAVENTLYWTTSRGSIGRSNLDGSNVQPNFVTGLRTPGTFVLNVETPVIDPIAFREQLTDPDSDGGGKWIDLKGQDVSLLSTLKSQAGNTETVIIIVNGTEAEITYYRVDYEGNEISYGRIAPGAFANQHTYVGHVWLTKDASGADLAAFRAVEKTGRALIEVDVKITEPAKLSADVNNDGVVNIQDLVLVASNFGKAEENAADVNGDGVVNITDLVKVAGALGNAAAAPALHAQLLQTFTASDVRQWLSESQYLDLTDATLQTGVYFLEQLLAALIPNETVLLANYPNPFNPETWIPYQLSKPADVTLTIYAVNGQMVRRLVLGHQLAGIYQNRGRAAYWDGRNKWGEPVASSVYFYTLTAGDFTATRKLLIRK